MRSPCNVTGCDLPQVARGWCQRHYHRWRRYGDLNVRDPDRGCSVGDCQRKHYAHGLCKLHLRRVESRGATDWTPPTIHDRLWRRIAEMPDGCWEWTAARNAQGYGQVKHGPGMRPVHKVVWEFLVGPVPDGLHLDHLCRNRACCNPEHLEPVTPAENARRGAGSGGVLHPNCPQGHPYVDEHRDKRGNRECRTCRKEQRRARSARERAATTSLVPTPGCRS